jgi:hypothetical protein
MRLIDVVQNAGVAVAMGAGQVASLGGQMGHGNLSAWIHFLNGSNPRARVFASRAPGYPSRHGNTLEPSWNP